MYTVYILYSEKINKYYVGQTEDITVRLQFHLSSQSPYTSQADDWHLVYIENYLERKEAVIRERAIKKKKSRKYIEWLVGSVKD